MLNEVAQCRKSKEEFLWLKGHKFLTENYLSSASVNIPNKCHIKESVLIIHENKQFLGRLVATSHDGDVTEESNPLES